jgi:Spy/CpxP family protein refolding chaperone
MKPWAILILVVSGLLILAAMLLTASPVSTFAASHQTTPVERAGRTG